MADKLIETLKVMAKKEKKVKEFKRRLRIKGRVDESQQQSKREN